ncbi:hypothetical protein EV421DRAFT_2025952 [Armillaria borealis]|uniref:Uncharacterized protein n=1 Tax=Armillaria borealis TaxID=47425 RepID=A0AA39IU50_9AGAR|nr:hypothetical protein EV421DRAFT_2025952 [Armillaria borealis]
MGAFFKTTATLASFFTAAGFNILCRLARLTVTNLDEVFFNDGSYLDNGLESENARALNDRHSALPIIIDILYVDLNLRRHWSDHSSGVGTVTCYVPALENGCLLLVDLQGIAVKSRRDNPLLCTSSTYGSAKPTTMHE